MRLFIEDTPWGFDKRPLRTWVDYKVNGQKIELMWTCLDQIVTAEITEWNGPVYQDSCVEFFFSTSAKPDVYFNLEVNSKGIIHLAVGKDRNNRQLIDVNFLKSIEVINLIEGKKWTFSLILDLEKLCEVSKIPVSPKGIKGNFYRCGGEGNPYQSWAKIDTPKPDFHRPDFFKVLM